MSGRLPAEPDPVPAGDSSDLSPPEARPGDQTAPGGGPQSSGDWVSVLDSLAGRMVSVPRVLLRSATGGAPDSVVRTSSDEIPKGPTGRYQLHGEIARGGMGVVVRGRDTDLGRDLAVKILLERHKNRPELLQRFVEEAQIGGQLQHPGIVPVYELGTMPGGRPFFSMKLVKGKTLAALLASRRDPGEERAKLLGIFEQISQTLAYAHARGVIHRDLKPSNVMVGAFGEVQVMDWGLAKVLPEGGIADEKKAAAAHTAVSVIRTDRSAGSASGSGSETLAGSVLGTPAYMAPEQARGEVDLVDERADVFGLGAILCETLTGEPAFTGRPAEAQRKAQLGEVQDAFLRLDRSGAEAELVALAKRCLAAEPWNRPRHAGEVAETVASHFQSTARKLREAEIARAAETARAEEAVLRVAEEQKAREAAQARVLAERRARRTTVALAATILIALTGAGGGWLWVSGQREAHQRRVTSEVHAALERVAALRERARASPAEDPTSLAAALANAERARSLADEEPLAPALKTQIAALLAELRQEERDRALLSSLGKARDAGAATDVATSYFRSGPVIPLYRAALEAWGVSVGAAAPADAVRRIESARPEVRSELIRTLDHWQRIAVDAPQNEPLLAWIEEVLSRADNDPWRQDVRKAAREQDPNKRRETLIELARSADLSRQPIGLVLSVALQLQELGASDAEFPLIEGLWWRHPESFTVNAALFDANYYAQPRRVKESLRYASAMVAIRPDSPGALLNLAASFAEAGRPDDAIIADRKAIALAPGYGAAHNGLGNALFSKGRVDEAIVAYREAVRLGPNDPEFHFSLANALRDAGKREEALAGYGEAIRLRDDYAEAHLNRGGTLLDLGRFAEAAASFRRAHELGSKRPNWQWASAEMLRTAEMLAKTAAGLDEVISGALKPGSAGETRDYAWCAYLKRRYLAAEKLYQAALTRYESEGGDPPIDDRYNAACAAALAASGLGEDAATLDGALRAGLRAQALAWLGANLKRHREELANEPATHASKLEGILSAWQGDSDLAGVRDEEALSKLPAEEAGAWRALWRDVKALQQRAGESGKSRREDPK